MIPADLDKLKALLELANLVERAQTLNLITPEERQAASDKVGLKAKIVFSTLLP